MMLFLIKHTTVVVIQSKFSEEWGFSVGDSGAKPCLIINILRTPWINRVPGVDNIGHAMALYNT